MYKRNNWSFLVFMILGIFIIAGCSSNNNGSSDNDTNTEGNNATTDEVEEVSIQLAHHHAAGSVLDNLANDIAEKVSNSSDGNMTIDVFPSGQLGEEMELIEGLDIGTVDMAMVSPSLMSDFGDVFGVDTLPFIFEDTNHVSNAFNGEFGDNLKEILLDNSNINMQGYIIFGARQMFTTEKVENLDDFKGLKIRSPEAWMWSRMFELLKANPTPIPFGEAYTAIENNVVSSMDVPPSMAIDLNLDEVVDNVALTDHMYGTMSISINNDLYQDLSDAQKKILDEAINETLEHYNSEVIPKDEEEKLQQLEENGVSINEATDIDEWKNSVEQMYDEFKERAPVSEELIDNIFSAAN